MFIPNSMQTFNNADGLYIEVQQGVELGGESLHIFRHPGNMEARLKFALLPAAGAVARPCVPCKLR